MSGKGEGKRIKKKGCLGKEGNYDCEEGSSAMADGRRVRIGLLLRPSGSNMWTTMNRLLAYFSSSFITLFSHGSSDDADPCFGCSLHRLLAQLRQQIL